MVDKVKITTIGPMEIRSYSSTEDELKETKDRGGAKMAENEIQQEVVCPEECVGCPEGCPDIGPIEACIPPEDIEFCFTLVVPAGFSIPGDTLAEQEEFIAENFDVAAYFLEEEGCFECFSQECAIDTEFTGVGVTEVFIEGCIKLIGGLCVASDSAPETGSQAPVCTSTIICVDEFTPVCLDSEASCENLRVIGANDIIVDFVETTCSEFCRKDGDEIWEIRGVLEFACGPCPIEQPIDDC
ncbi:hypothetical protein JCM16358_02600 [Halanaerocella petrolearia]